MRELELLQHVYAANGRLPEAVTIPPGDDMGAMRIAGSEVLVTVDQVADGVHFDLATTPLEKIGRKAITRNLSDVAAMAAVPDGAVVAATLPRGFTSQQADQLYDAMRTTGAQFDCAIIGGDTAVWDGPLIITVTVFAHCQGNNPIRRCGAQVGDAICVTGKLGGSIHTFDGYTHHLDFTPRVALARSLANDYGIQLNAMIDLSDGLATDLAHICAMSRVRARVQLNQLPISKATHAATAGQGERKAWQHALCDGEDYELCFTLPAADAKRALPREIDGVRITEIGVVIADDDNATSPIDLIDSDGTISDCDTTGWEHRGIDA